MFDWNDEELTDIVWGEASENGDHIVPYPKGGEEKSLVTFGTHSSKQWSKEDSPDKLEEQNKPGASNDLSVSKLESSSQFNTDGHSALEMDTWPNSPLPSATCRKEYAARNAQDSMDTARLDNDPQVFGDEHEEIEDGDFLDYSWANIGSFDDLDRIFRNDDPIFGCESLGNGDELWSSSADVISSPIKSFPISAGSLSLSFGELRNTSEQYEIKMEPVHHEDKPTGCGRTSYSNTHFLNNVEPSTDNAAGTGSCTILVPAAAVENAGGKSKPLVEEKTDTKMIGKIDSHSTSENSATQKDFASKVNGQGDLMKRPKKEEESERKSRDLSGAWSPGVNQFRQFGNQLSTSSMQNFPSSVLTPHRQLGGPQSLTYLQASHPYLSTGYGNPTNHYPVVPVFPHINSERDKDQSTLAGYRYPQLSPKHLQPLKKFPNVLSRSMTMTPQEKIEKLRRRQQMQAMLAIQEQQQQFGNQVTATDYSDTQKCLQENQSQDTEGSNIDDEENLKFSASLESPIEQDDSNTIAMLVDDCSVEERVLDQLHDVIEKLDISIRLCIRDSLFRLAQSATQRHNSNDTSNSNNCTDEHEVIIKEETEGHNRSSRVPDAETETNPIDRTMAHLLFRRPLESSSTKPLKDGQLTESTDRMSKPKTDGFMNLPVGCLSNDSTDKQRLSNPPWIASESYHVNQFRNNTFISTPENTSNDEPEDGLKGVVEASK